MERIEFVSLREARTPFVRPGVYAMRKDRKHLWLQKLAIWTLEKLGAHWIDEKVEFKKVRIDAASFMDRLYKQRADLFCYFNRDAKTLLIGTEDFKQMMGEPEINQYLTFAADVRMGRRIMGLEVKVIPWMRGIVVI